MTYKIIMNTTINAGIVDTYETPTTDSRINVFNWANKYIEMAKAGNFHRIVNIACKEEGKDWAIFTALEA